MNTDELQNLDIEQARIIISLKNDEINNLKAALRTTEIKNSLRQADLKHKIDQGEHKLSAGEAKLQKSEENARKIKALLQQEAKRFQRQIEKGKQNSQKVMAQTHQKERELNGILFEEKLKLEREKQHSARLSAQLEVVLKYFDPKKVLNALQKQKLEQVPTYLQLYEKWKNTKEALDFANHHLTTIKAEIVSEMEKSFEKLSSYESVMEDLKAKNEELRLSVEEKEQLIKYNSKEISSKQNLIENIKQEADLHLQHLNQEIVSLKQQVASYEHLQSKESSHNPISVYLQQIDELQRRLYEKQLQLDHLSSLFEERIFQLQNQNRTLKEALQQAKLDEGSKLTEYIMRLNDYEQEKDSQRELILLLNATVKDQEESIAELTKQLNKRSEQITQILSKRKKLEEEYRKTQQNLKTNFQNCSEELEYLKQKLILRGETQQIRSRKFSFSQKSMTSNEQDNSKKLTRVMSGGSSFRGYAGSKNLLIDLAEELNSDDQDGIANKDLDYYEANENWAQKYHNLLAKHNQFMKIVFSQLRNINPQGVRDKIY